MFNEFACSVLNILIGYTGEITNPAATWMINIAVFGWIVGMMGFIYSIIVWMKGD